MSMAKPRRKKPSPVNVIEPTPEQYAKGQFTRANLAHRRIPVIETMWLARKLTQRQYDGLNRYRDVAIAEERSPTRDSLDKALHGRGGSTDGTGYIRIAHELGRLEQALGSLRCIARAIAVDDMTASQWAIMHWGGRERRDGNVTYIAPRSKTACADTILDLQMAGERLAAAIGC